MTTFPPGVRNPATFIPEFDTFTSILKDPLGMNLEKWPMA